jgi:hypothetical protein
MFNAAKDALTSRAARTWANQLISRYGEVSDLRIDTRRKTVEVTCRLEGEASSITVNITNYEVITVGDKKYLSATRFSCTRLWLQNVLNDHGPRQRVELPAWAAVAL